MLRVFISHNHTDDMFVDRLCADLEKRTLQTFVDHRSINPGDHWPTSVQTALKSCDKMIAVISDNSVNSRNCTDEWDYFLDWTGDKKKEIIPVRLTGIEPYYRLVSFHYVDFQKSYEDALNQLIMQLTDNLIETTPVPPRREDTGETLHAMLQERYPLVRLPEKGVGIATGNIAEIVGADVLVNSENDRLYLDDASLDAEKSKRSVSAAIHSYGAEWNEKGQLVKDLIKLDLERTIRRIGLIPPVPISTVVDTTAGSLERLGIRRVIYTVTVSGTRRKGVVSVTGTVVQLRRCIANTLRRIDDLNAEQFEDDPLRRVVFPVFGTGGERQPYEVVAPALVERAIEYLEYEHTEIETIYFLAHRQKNWAMLTEILSGSPDLNKPVSQE